MLRLLNLKLRLFVHWFKKDMDIGGVFKHINTALKDLIPDTETRYVATQLLLPIMGNHIITVNYIEKFSGTYSIPPKKVDIAIESLKQIGVFTPNTMPDYYFNAQYEVKWDFFEKYIKQVFKIS